MRRRPVLPRTLLAALCLALGAPFGPHALAQPPPTWWRALYRGTAGAQTVELDLTLRGAQATGRVLLPDAHRVLEASGSAADDGSVALSLTAPAGRAGTPPPAAGSLEGRRSLAPNDDGSRFTGSLLLGSGAEPLALTRIAQYVRIDVLDGPIHAQTSYPRFLDPRLAAVNAELAPGERAGLDSFVREGRDAGAADALFHSYELIATTRLEGLAGPYVSLRSTRYRFTGGAHGFPDTETATWWLDPSGPRRLSLAELFAPGAAYVARIAPLVLADLAAEGASWVVQGQVTALSAQDLALYALTPAGIAFTFPPYAMGPYAQGTFTAVVPYRDVIDLAAANGALDAFAGGGP